MDYPLFIIFKGNLQNNLSIIRKVNLEIKTLLTYMRKTHMIIEITNQGAE